jgi:predicted ABC-type ATPase
MAKWPKPFMMVIAGPSGSGKSTAFPSSELGSEFRCDHFNIDDRCAELNDHSYQQIPPEIRDQAIKECRNFIKNHILNRQSFVVETTLRTQDAITQAKQAKKKGFFTIMFYIGTEDVKENIERVRKRALGGGHAAPPKKIVATYQASMKNLPVAMQCFDRVFVYDNSDRISVCPNTKLEGLKLVLVVEKGNIQPQWLHKVLQNLKTKKNTRKPK